MNKRRRKWAKLERERQRAQLLEQNRQRIEQERRDLLQQKRMEEKNRAFLNQLEKAQARQPVRRQTFEQPYIPTRQVERAPQVQGGFPDLKRSLELRRSELPALHNQPEQQPREQTAAGPLSEFSFGGRATVQPGPDDGLFLAKGKQLFERPDAGRAFLHNHLDKPPSKPIAAAPPAPARPQWLTDGRARFGLDPNGLSLAKGKQLFEPWPAERAVGQEQPKAQISGPVADVPFADSIAVPLMGKGLLCDDFPWLTVPQTQIEPGWPKRPGLQKPPAEKPASRGPQALLSERLIGYPAIRGFDFGLKG